METAAHFDSFGAFAETARSTTTAKHEVNDDRMEAFCAGEHDTLTESWLGVSVPSGHEEAMKAVHKLATRGWPAGVKRLEQAMTQVVPPKPKCVRRTPVWSDRGDHLDMDRVYSGQLDTAWRRTQRLSGTGPTRVTIVCPIAISCSTSSDVIFWRGAACTKLADALSAAGYNVRILLALASTDKCGAFEAIYAEVKSYLGPWDLSTVASALCLPATFRMLGFGVMPAVLRQTLQSNLNYPAQVRPGDVPSDGGVTFVVPNAGYIPGSNNKFADGNLDDADAANTWVNACIASLD